MRLVRDHGRQRVAEVEGEGKVDHDPLVAPGVGLEEHEGDGGRLGRQGLRG